MNGKSSGRRRVIARLDARKARAKSSLLEIDSTGHTIASEDDGEPTYYRYRMVEGSPLVCREQEFQPYLSLCDDEEGPFVDAPPAIIGH